MAVTAKQIAICIATTIILLLIAVACKTPGMLL